MSLQVDIKKRFKGFTLDVRFSSGGAPLGILGSSGSGKSMTLRCIAGVETPDEGHISVNGRVLFDSEAKIDLPPQKRRIGYLFQSYALFPNMTVAQNIACALPGPKRAKAAAVEALVRRFSLDGLQGRYPAQLSGGQQQRVALARILAYEPEALLLDEPFSALDTHLREKLQVEMGGLLAEYPGDAVMVTHSRDEVYQLCSDLLVLEEGRTLAIGKLQEMFRHPALLGVARLTGCKNFSAARKTGEDEVEALDWGLRLQVAGPVPDDVSYIGVRAHDFHPSHSEGDENRFAVAIGEHVETPFEWDILFRAQSQRAGAEDIWWKFAKEHAPDELPDHLCVAPGKVLLLRES